MPVCSTRGWSKTLRHEIPVLYTVGNTYQSWIEACKDSSNFYIIKRTGLFDFFPLQLLVLVVKRSVVIRIGSDPHHFAGS